MSTLPNVRLQRARRQHIQCAAARAASAGQRLVRSPLAAPAAEQRLSKQRISLPHRMSTHVLAQRAAQHFHCPWLNGSVSKLANLRRRTGECEQWRRLEHVCKYKFYCSFQDRYPAMLCVPSKVLTACQRRNSSRKHSLLALSTQPFFDVLTAFLAPSGTAASLSGPGDHLHQFFTDCI